jgi:glycosyltransferase involved in cell wall biosynthesis
MENRRNRRMVQQVRVLVLIPHLGGGGAEQVTALLAQGLSREKYELHLGLATAPDAGSESLPPWVTVHSLGARRVRAAAVPLLRLVRRLRPQLILSGMAHLNFLVLLLRPFFPHGTRVLVRQNATASAVLAEGKVPSFTRWLYLLLYRRADCIICQSRAMAADLAAVARIEPGRIAVLPNPIDIPGILAALDGPSQWSGPGPHLLAVGRLAPEKGFDLLLAAFVRVRQRFPAASLVICGAGPEETALKALCRSLGLESAVRFAGHVESPYVLFPGAALFVLSSRHEGMPNALLEAAAAGLPIVALPSSGGVVDLLRDRPGAWIAAEISAEALAASLLEALAALHPGERFSSLLEIAPSALRVTQ